MYHKNTSNVFVFALQDVRLAPKSKKGLQKVISSSASQGGGSKVVKELPKKTSTIKINISQKKLMSGCCIPTVMHLEYKFGSACWAFCAANKHEK